MKNLQKLFPCYVIFLIWVVEMSVYWIHFPGYDFGWVVVGLALYIINLEDFQSIANSRCNFGNLAYFTLIGLGSFLVLTAWRYKWYYSATPAFGLIFSLGIQLLIIAQVQSIYGFSNAKKLIYPFLFLYISVPLPAQVWDSIVHTLQSAITDMTSGALVLVGFPVTVRGTLIQLNSTTFSVEEACSGVKSLQTNLMLSAFLAKVTLNPGLGRLVLILLGLVAAVFGNIVRTFMLVVCVNYFGISTFETFHFYMGWMVLVIGGVIIFGAKNLIWRVQNYEPNYES